MKRHLIVCIALFFIFHHQVFPENYAVIIGIDVYTGIWPPLKNAVNDCKSLNQILKSKYGFTRLINLYNENATRHNILSTLNSLDSELTDEDNLIIYFAGHGFTDKTFEGYWVSADVQTKNTYECISNSDIKTVIARLNVKHTLLIADACFSGTLFRGVKVLNKYDHDFYENMNINFSRQAISSGGVQEVLDGHGNGHSIFAHYLLKILSENEKQLLEISEISQYLRVTVPANSPNSQQPEFGRLDMTGHEGGSFIFENLEWKRPAIEPQISILSESPSDNNKNQLKIGVVNYKGKESIHETFTPFTNYLAQKIEKEPYLEVVNYEHLAQKLHNGEFDIGVFSPFTYIEAKNAYPDLDVFAIHKAKGRIGYYGVIIVRKESGITNLLQLEGKNFLFVHSKSTSGYQYPIKYFRQNGIEPDESFFNYGFSGSHKESIEALSIGKIDGIATYLEALEDYGTNIDTSEFKIIYQSPLIPYNAYVFSPKLDQESREFLENIMFNAHNYSKNEKMFNNRLKIEGWQKCTDDYYNCVRDYLDIKRLKQSVSIDINTKSTDVLNEIVPLEFLKESINFEIVSTDRFSISNKENAETFDIVLSLTAGNDHGYFIININSQPMNRGKILLNNIEADISSIVCNTLLQNTTIETTLDYDGKIAFVPFGIDDGISENYSFMIFNKKSGLFEIIATKEVYIRQPNTTFSNKYNSKDKGSKVKIVYNGG